MAVNAALAYWDPDGDIVDAATFEQILEIDDDDDFSLSLVNSFFEQAGQTFQTMDTALDRGDLATLSSQGHFLKGSSATLGLSKVKDSCEKIQHYGAKKDEGGNPTNHDDAHYLDLLRKKVDDLKRECADAERVLKGYYERR